MPRNLSFMLTTEQFRNRTKDVTRRLGWLFLKPGDVLCGVEKSQGLGKGGKINRLGMIVVRDVRREPLREMIDRPIYGGVECAREGFPRPHRFSTPERFVDFFCETHKGVRPETIITRIEFGHLNEEVTSPVA